MTSRLKQKKWSELTGDEKVARREYSKAIRTHYDPDLEAWNALERQRKRKIKKHVQEILKLRNAS